MSTKELERLKIIEKCVSKELSQKNGAKQRHCFFTPMLQITC